MATRVENILAKARVTLADKDKERWTDSDLLMLLDEGHKDFCRQTQLLHGQADIPLVVGDAYFSLPDDCWLLTRVLYDDAKLPLVSHTELDTTGAVSFTDFSINYAGYQWETATGKPAAIIYDRRNLLDGKVFPIPDESIVVAEYTFQDDPSGPFEGSGLLGVTADITDYTFNSEFGVIVDMYDPQIDREFFPTPFGVTTDVSENSGLIHCYYVRNPGEVTDLDSELDTPYMFDTALKYYVVGHAFMNDIDTEYQAKGAQQLQLYERELALGQKTEMLEGTRAGQLGTTYRRAF